MDCNNYTYYNNNYYYITLNHENTYSIHTQECNIITKQVFIQIVFDRMQCYRLSFFSMYDIFAFFWDRLT